MSLPSPFASASIRSSLIAVLVGLLVPGAASAQPDEHTRRLPVEFSAHRIYIHPVTANGDTLRLYTDTGGGNILVKPTAERLDLPMPDTTVVRGRPTPVAILPDFPSLPSVPKDRVLVFPAGGHAQLMNMGDGMLGRSWFDGHVWTFDYRQKHLLLHESANHVSLDAPHTVSLGFKTDSDGQRVEHFPSVETTIDGETHAFLFDTGASMVLRDSVHAARGGPRVRGASFVAASLFNQWREAHPDWPVRENTAISAPIIEVPEVTIAGHTVGPVRFVRRPDRNFHQGMSSMMDRRVEGALGGSLFQYFTITVDYPNARARFQRPAR